MRIHLSSPSFVRADPKPTNHRAAHTIQGKLGGVAPPGVSRGKKLGDQKVSPNESLGVSFLATRRGCVFQLQPSTETLQQKSIEKWQGLLMIVSRVSLLLFSCNPYLPNSTRLDWPLAPVSHLHRRRMRCRCLGWPAVCPAFRGFFSALIDSNKPFQ